MVWSLELKYLDYSYTTTRLVLARGSNISPPNIGEDDVGIGML